MVVDLDHEVEVANNEELSLSQPFLKIFFFYLKT